MNTEDQIFETNAPFSPPPELQLLLEDGPLIAVNKPNGLLTQGIPGAQPSLEGMVKAYLKNKLSKPGNVYLGVPHRLDRPVSGVVIFAKNSKAAARLAEQFRERSLRKIYLAVTETVPQQSHGRLIDWLLKDAEAAHVSVASSSTVDARHAVLDYQVIAVNSGRALVRIELGTGRMHQIRVQLSSRGWPIVGDCQYGATMSLQMIEDPLASPIALHAWQLSLKHPIRYDTVQIQAPVPSFWSQFGLLIPDEAMN